MESFEHNLFGERVHNSKRHSMYASIEETQQWVGGLPRRRSLSISGPELNHGRQDSLRELEVRYHIEDVWGRSTTPAMQTLECIQKVKQALVEEDTQNDMISSGTFSVLVTVSILAAVAIVIAWELYLRPRSQGLPQS